LRAALKSPALDGYAGQFVWLDLNYDEPRNAAFLAAHITGTPTLLVMDPASGTVLDAWTGSATPAQLATMFTHALAPPGDQADVALRRGDALLGGNDFKAAATAYEQALAAGGAQWPGRWHAMEQLIGALSGPGSPPRACADRAVAEAPSMPREHPFVSVALVGMQCLQGEPSLIGTPEGDRIEALAAEALALPVASEDEHYMMYDAMYAIRTQTGDAAGAHAVADVYMAYTESMPPPTTDDERRARDQSRLRAAVKLGTTRASCRCSRPPIASCTTTARRAGSPRPTTRPSASPTRSPPRPAGCRDSPARAARSGCCWCARPPRRRPRISPRPAATSSWRNRLLVRSPRASYATPSRRRSATSSTRCPGRSDRATSRRTRTVPGPATSARPCARRRTARETASACRAA
jgi:hypothetical protein